MKPSDDTAVVATLFLSYAREDLGLAHELVERLRTLGLGVTWDQDLVPGPDYWDQIREIIGAADAAALVVTGPWVASAVCLKEAAFATQLGKRLLPIVPGLLADELVSSLPESVRRPHWVVAGEPEQIAMQLAKVARTDLDLVNSHSNFTQAARAWSIRRGPLLDRHGLRIANELFGRVRARPESGIRLGDELEAYVRASRRALLRSLALSVAGAAIFLLVSGSLAFGLRQSRHRQRTEQALKLAFAAQGELGRTTGDMNRAMEQAGLALQTEVSEEANKALRNALALAPLPGPVLERGTEPSALQFGCNGQYVARLADENVRVWRTKDWSEVPLSFAAGGGVQAIALAASAPTMAVQSGDRIVFVDLERAPQAPLIAIDSNAGTDAIMLSDKGTLAVLMESAPATEGPGIRFVDARTGATTAWAQEPHALDSAILGGEEFLAGSVRFGGVVVWRAKDGVVAGRTTPNVSGAREPLAFSDDLRCILILGDELSIEPIAKADGEHCQVVPELFWNAIVNSEDSDDVHVTQGRVLHWRSRQGLTVSLPSTPEVRRPWDTQLFAEQGTSSAVVAESGAIAATRVDSQSSPLRIWTFGEGETARISYSGKMTYFEAGHYDPIPTFELSPDGKVLIAALRDAGDYVLRPFSTQGYRPLLFGVAPGNATISIPDPSDTHVATGDEAGIVSVKRLADDRTWVSMSIQSEVSALAFSADGETLAIGDHSGTVTAWRWKDEPSLLSQARHARDLPIEAVAISSDGLWLASTGRDNAGRLWRLPNMQPGPVLTHADSINQSVTDVAFSPDSGRVVTSSLDGTAAVWDVATGAQKFSVTPGGWVQDIALAASGSDFATVGHTEDDALGNVCVWSMTDGTRRFCDTLSKMTNRGAISPDGSWLVVAAGDWGGIRGTTRRDGSVYVYRLPDGKRVAEFPDPWTVWDIAFSADGAHVASISEGGTISVYDMDRQQLVSRFDASTGGRSLAIGSTGKLIVVAGSGYVWRPDDLLAERDRRMLSPSSQ